MWKPSDDGGDDFDDGCGCEQRPVLRRDRKRQACSRYPRWNLVSSFGAGISSFAYNPLGKQTWSKRHSRMIKMNTICGMVVKAVQSLCPIEMQLEL